MYLGRRDLIVARGRFLLVGAVIALLALLSTVLSGLASGLVDDGISGLRSLPITHLAFQKGAESAFSRSTLTADALAAFDRDELEATPVGVSFVNAASDAGASVDIALFGVDPDGFLAASSPSGGASSSGGGIEDGLVLSESLREEVELGTLLTVVGSAEPLPVIGFTFGGTYGHVPIAYTALDTWQRLVYGDDARGRFSAIAIRASEYTDFVAIDQAAGTETGTKADAYDGSPGFTAETATMSLIRGFLLVIAALVVGAFFTVWTVQRQRQIGLLKALGASTAYIVRDALGQLAVLLVAAIAVGTAAGLLVGGLVDAEVPFRLSSGSVALSSLLLGLMGLGGSLVAIRRFTSVDPVISLRAEP